MNKQLYILFPFALLLQSCLYTQFATPTIATVTIFSPNTVVHNNAPIANITVTLKNVSSWTITFIDLHEVSTHNAACFWNAEIVYEDSIHMMIPEVRIIGKMSGVKRSSYTKLLPGDSSQFIYQLDLSKMVFKGSRHSDFQYAKQGKYNIRLTYSDSWAEDLNSISEPIKSNWIEFLYSIE